MSWHWIRQNWWGLPVARSSVVAVAVAALAARWQQNQTKGPALCNPVYSTTYLLAYYTCALASPSQQTRKSSQFTPLLHHSIWLNSRQTKTKVNWQWHDLSGFSQTKDERCVWTSSSTFFILSTKQTVRQECRGQRPLTLKDGFLY